MCLHAKAGEIFVSEDGLQVEKVKRKWRHGPHRSQHKKYNNFWALQTTIGGSYRDLQRKPNPYIA